MKRFSHVLIVTLIFPGHFIYGPVLPRSLVILIELFTKGIQAATTHVSYFQT